MSTLMNTPRLFARMKAEGLDAVVATAPENVTYTSGFWAMSQWIRRGPQAYVLTPAEGKGQQAVIASTGTLDLLADQEVPVEDVRRYGFFAIESDALCIDHDEKDKRVSRLLEREDPGDAVAALVAAIKDRGMESATIGVDEIGIIPQYLD
ncbi:MAG: aminopeptidase P family protein, partial [Alphaproteobacteria bacterium]|nr:aminopeptidase P family protein [Alphaproteobacteria bacterium]